MNSYGLDLDNLAQFADTRLDPVTHARVPASSHTPYGLTKCAALGHELVEALDVYRNGFDYDLNHGLALEWENNMRAEIGQLARSDDRPIRAGFREITVGQHRILLDGTQHHMRIIYPDSDGGAAR